MMWGWIVGGALLMLAAFGYTATRGRSRPPGLLAVVLVMAVLLGGMFMIIFGMDLGAAS